jgi:hypothetical protein
MAILTPGESKRLNGLASSGGRSNPRDGRIRADIEFIRCSPVCCDRMLG